MTDDPTLDAELAASRWDEVARVFGLAMDAQGAERRAIVARQCGDDAALRREVEALLDADEATVGDVAGLVAEAVEELVTQPGEPPSVADHQRLELGPGDRIDDRYVVTRLLGAGGMGMVVAAEHEALREPVAIKLLRPGVLASERARTRFLREARAAARIRSPHVVNVRDVGTLPSGAPFMVMDHLEGADLAAVLAHRGQLPFPEACRITLQACEALATAHARGVIHRDIKPGNLFLERPAHGELTLVLLDFGISKLTGPDADGEGVLTRTTDMVGSPAYMSPEQLRSARDVDPRSDLWSLGVVLYEMLGGARPFRADNVADLTRLILAEPPPPLADVPAGLAAVVERCLAKDREARHADVGALAIAVAPFCGSDGHRLARRVGAILSDPPPLEEHPPDGLDLETAETLALAETQAARASALPTPRSEPPPSEPSRSSGAAPRRTWLLAVAAVAVVAGGVAWSQQETSTAPSPTSDSAAPSLAPTASHPATSSHPAPSTSASIVATASAPPASSSTSAAPRPTSPRPAAPPTSTGGVDPYGSRK